MYEDLENARILIVDDVIKNIQVLGGILQKEGFEINVAQNGVQALETVKIMPPDLILLDIIMPEMDGVETCRRIKENPATKDIPVIFLTAKVETSDLIKGFELGAVDYVTKPFDSKELIARVKTHLELKLSKEIIKKQSNERKELIHILCHDLVNPLSQIKNIISMSKKKPDFLLKKRNLLENAVNNSLEIIELVRKMRALDDRKINLILSSVNLKQIISEAIVMLQEKFENKEINIVYDVDEKIFVRLEKHSFINSVLNNILTNAIKFSFHGSTITITVHKQVDVAVLYIEDNGIGMSEDLLSDINLNKFNSRRGTEGENGTGFGIQLIKKFINVYGGEIEISSKEKTEGSLKHGTCVKLVLKTC